MTLVDDEKNDLFKSQIIDKNDEKRKEEINKIKEWLVKPIKEIKKIYDTSSDTANAGCFHRKCDNKGPTLILIKSTNGSRFGGYTSENWGATHGACIKDDTAFLFSLTHKKKFKVDLPTFAIHNNRNFGPIFGDNNGDGHDILISNYCTQNNESHTSGCYYPLDSKYFLNNGTKNFTVQVYEVYQILYV